MKYRKCFMMLVALLSMSFVACNSNNNEQVNNDESKIEEVSSISSNGSTKKSSSSKEESQGPVKEVNISSVSLTTENSKGYIIVKGSQTNYTEDDFKWAWGLKEQQSGTFIDGKAKPSDEDFEKVSFDSNNEFTVKYCLTDIENMKSGVLYRIYGGTKESYNDIQFASNNFGANDGTRKYYLRNDENNSLVFDSIQPINFTKASIVSVGPAALPEGVTQVGAYVRFGGVNSKNLTIENIDAYKASGSIAGSFQRVIGGDYSLHEHSDAERFYKIEDNYIYFYCYVGFIEANEGWMMHFDMVGGNANSNLTFNATFDGSTPYEVNGATYKVYADSSLSGEENYWGCLGIFRSV